jgi:Tol biopolymer transport system component
MIMMNLITKMKLWFCLIFMVLLTACVGKINHTSKYPLMVIAGRDRLLFFGYRVIYAVDESGTLLNLDLPRQEDIGYDPTWSPDGRWIAHSYTNPHPFSASDYDLYIMDATNYSKNIRVTHSVYPWCSAWSPDSSQIALCANETDSPHEHAIYLLNVKCILQGESCSPEPTFLIPGNWPDWSPDGNKIAYLDGTSDQIRVVDIHNPNEVVTISQGLKGCDSAKWSPDGKRIAFVCDETIYSVDSDGGNLINLVKGGVDLKWTPDGKKIAFIGTEILDPNLGGSLDFEGTNSTTAIFMMDANGANVTRITKSNEESIGPFMWIPMSKLETGH